MTAHGEIYYTLVRRTGGNGSSGRSSAPDEDTAIRSYTTEAAARQAQDRMGGWVRETDRKYRHGERVY